MFKIQRGFVLRLIGASALCTTGLVSAVGIASSSGATRAPHITGHVLLVGTYKGHAGQYSSIQAAVNHARSGDWIFVAPGDYHETTDLTSPPSSQNQRNGDFGSVLISTPGIHLRGVNRNTVIVDGTKVGAPACSTSAGDQVTTASGRNGIVIYKANKVSIENLTTCNFRSGGGDSGNGIWWNGGAGSGTIGLTGYSGAYLTATTTFFDGEQNAGTYGIFSSDAAGPATWNTIYASNQNDSGMYVGACLQLCGITISNAWMEYSALGYSGTNSGGAIVIKNSLFDHNEDGLDTNTAISGDPPAPQNGACPNNGISMITHTHSCWVLMNNVFDSNNNPNTPRAGSAAAGPTGTGLTISGGRNDTVMNNKFTNNGAWGLLVVPYPDQGTPGFGQTCLKVGGGFLTGLGCIIDAQNVTISHNTFKGNGFFGNPSNSDIGLLALFSGQKQNCFIGNTTPDGTYPVDLQATMPTCGAKSTTAVEGALLGQALCDTGFGACPSGSVYPQPTGVIIHPLPTSKLISMPNPCKGLPTNAWCKSGHLI